MQDTVPTRVKSDYDRIKRSDIEDKKNEPCKILVFGPKSVGKTSLITAIKGMKDNKFEKVPENLLRIQPTVEIELNQGWNRTG